MSFFLQTEFWKSKLSRFDLNVMRLSIETVNQVETEEEHVGKRRNYGVELNRVKGVPWRIIPRSEKFYDTSMKSDGSP